jgi:uncharacterized protein YuzE
MAIIKTNDSNVVGIEILNASSKLPQPNIVEYEMA